MARRPSCANEPSSKLSNSRARRGPLEFHFLTLFPEVFPGVLGSSLLGKARDRGHARFEVTDIRDFATDRHRRVDDTPYGGGEGMLLKPDVLFAAWRHVVPRREPRTLTVLMSPQGEVLRQPLLRELALFRRLVLICGHYEGIDERFVDLCVDQEISIGDYVLTGGEIPALALADGVCRLIPGVVGNEDSLRNESLENDLLKYPQYTRPRVFRGLAVPEVLLGGNHRDISRWRGEQREERTRERRPDLWKAHVERIARDRGP